MDALAFTYIAVLFAVTVLAGPFMIGKPREPYTASTYVVGLVVGGLQVLAAFYLWQVA